MDEFTRTRVSAEKDNSKIKPVEMLQLMIHDIESGAITVDALTLLYVDRTKGDYGTYRCNMTYAEELVTLDLAHERAIRCWRNPK